MGNPQEFLTSPHIRPSSNAGNLAHYLQQPQRTHFLNETPLQAQMPPQAFLSSPPSIAPVPRISFSSLNLV